MGGEVNGDHDQPDILRELTESEMIKMRDICAQHYPYTLRGYTFLRYQLDWIRFFRDPANSDAIARCGSIKRTVYTKRDGILENCTFLSISRDANLDIYAFSRDPAELAECIRHTKLIHWECGPQFVSHEGPHCAELKAIFREKNIEVTEVIDDDGYVLDKSEALKFDIHVPHGYVVKKLVEEDAKMVDHHWVYSYPGSYEWVRSIIILNESAGVFTKDTGELVAWILINDQFATGCLHTRPEYRRKGFAKILVKFLSKRVAEQHNEDAIAYIVHGNTYSENCYLQLGFKRVAMEMPGYVWYRTKRPVKN